MSNSSKPRLVKCVVVGDDWIGKTCMVFACSKMFSLEPATRGYDSYANVVIVDNTPVTLGLWDPCGISDYDRLIPLSFPQTDVFLLCYSMMNPFSLKQLADKWYPTISHHCPGTPFFIVRVQDELLLENLIERDQANQGNRGVRWIPPAEAQLVAVGLGAQKHLTYSVSNQEGLKRMFDEVIRTVLSPQTKPKRKLGFSFFSSKRH